MSPEEFIEWLTPAVTEICPQYNLPACVCIAQGALESGWGRYTIGQYNLFGRKAVDGDKSIAVETQEFYNGEWVTIIANFKDYDTLKEAIADWCILLTEEPCYAPCLEFRNDVEQFVNTLAPIYATDPEYASKIMSTIRNNDLC